MITLIYAINGTFESPHWKYVVDVDVICIYWLWTWKEFSFFLLFLFPFLQTIILYHFQGKSMTHSMLASKMFWFGFSFDKLKYFLQFSSQWRYNQFHKCQTVSLIGIENSGNRCRKMSPCNVPPMLPHCIHFVYLNALISHLFQVHTTIEILLFTERLRWNFW